MYQLIGIAGLLLISYGVFIRQSRRSFFSRQKDRKDWFYISGGILLEIYSIIIGDYIFIVLQAVFIAAAIFHLYKTKK